MCGYQTDTRYPTPATVPDPDDPAGSGQTKTLTQLRQATARLIRTVDGIEDDAWQASSRLPGWTRAHVVAHLALHAEAVEGAVRGVLEEEPVPMYPSPARRGDDIAKLATASPPVLRDRLLGATAELGQGLAVLATTPELNPTVIERTPGSARRFRAGQAGLRRLFEVEIHHVDLDLGYAPEDWPSGFVSTLLDTRAAAYDGGPFRAYASDRDAYWVFGVDGTTPPESPDWPHPTVRGPSAGLAWWATGRHPGDLLSCEGGDLPQMEAM